MLFISWDVEVKCTLCLSLPNIVEEKENASLQTEAGRDVNLITAPFISEIRVWQAAGSKLRATTASRAQMSLHHGNCWLPGPVQEEPVGGQWHLGLSLRAWILTPLISVLSSKPHSACVLNGKLSKNSFQYYMRSFLWSPLYWTLSKGGCFISPQLGLTEYVNYSHAYLCLRSKWPIWFIRIILLSPRLQCPPSHFSRALGYLGF